MFPSCCQVMYGTAPENAMSGAVASAAALESGRPSLAGSKWLPLIRRARKIAWRPAPVSSLQTTQGTAIPPGARGPAAMRGSPAALAGTALRLHSASAWRLEAQPGVVSTQMPAFTSRRWT